MSTLIGSDVTNIELTESSLQFKVNNVVMFSASGSQPGNLSSDFATVAYVDGRTLNDLATQTANYNAQGYKFTNLGAPT